MKFCRNCFEIKKKKSTFLISSDLFFQSLCVFFGHISGDVYDSYSELQQLATAWSLVSSASIAATVEGKDIYGFPVM